jgi:sugar phosphate isomerase/epimerase
LRHGGYSLSLQIGGDDAIAALNQSWRGRSGPTDVLAFAAAEGFSCIEAMCWPIGAADRKYAGVTHVDVTDFTPVRADDIRAACLRHGVALSGLGYYPNALDPDPAVAAAAVSHLGRVIEAAALLDLREVNTFVGRDWHTMVDDNWPRFLATWRPLVKLAEDHGVRIGVENCPMLFTRDEWPGGKNLMTTPAIWRRHANKRRVRSSLRIRPGGVHRPAG